MLSPRKRTKATAVEGINPITTKKIEFRISAGMDNCFGRVRPRQHGIADSRAQGSHRKNSNCCENSLFVGCS